MSHHVAYASTTRGMSHSAIIISNSSPVTCLATFTSSVANNLDDDKRETPKVVDGRVNACVDAIIIVASRNKLLMIVMVTR